MSILNCLRFWGVLRAVCWFGRFVGLRWLEIFVDAMVVAYGL
jgi:hypothetical protein